MRLGKLVYQLFFKPTANIRYNISHFGLKGYLKMQMGERAMKRHAATLTPITLTSDILLEVSYLTGEKYWHQTIFCAYSLAKQLHGRVAINVFSDGTLSQQHINLLKRALVNINIVSPEYIKQQLEELLPPSKFPALRALRDNNPMVRKLVDVRLNNRYLVQLDSDMLFFAPPKELVDSYNTKTYYYMQDTIPSFYAMPGERIREGLGIALQEKINAGILAFNSAEIDWHFLERACQFLIDNTEAIHAPSFEQTLNAIIICQLNGQALNLNYRIFYANVDDYTIATDVVRHYIFKAKLEYLQWEWKKVLA
ncbi:hypothetical protein [Mucilaginibacter pedocola]|uniref:Nucleotide-diphospho-sugar transferase domain-containing protein n=1 Tax=Mucilaginibacter pedocola TaxID=1792845 RepID=A0A1S9PCR8_9SPHI|nr:hypothetical protein [Mucilaginibacter pedocola]OOQ58755.1 hypothetical protein BC343_08855 [Mucilaginibacter pedocola]